MSENSFSVVAADVSRLKFHHETGKSAGGQSRLTPAAAIFQTRSKEHGKKRPNTRSRSAMNIALFPQGNLWNGVGRLARTKRNLWTSSWHYARMTSFSQKIKKLASNEMFRFSPEFSFDALLSFITARPPKVVPGSV
ncbi:MAG: hypothetical protein KGJ60_07090 [Verrucomicrobiota bacterium]|nr:hypothetical protein [Verrucomicrobiota bacterium]